MARFWTYHMWYDDLLVIIPMISLFRLAAGDGLDARAKGVSVILLFLLILFSLAPGGEYLFPSPWNIWYVNMQVGIWMAVLVFLVWRAARSHQAG